MAGPKRTHKKEVVTRTTRTPLTTGRTRGRAGTNLTLTDHLREVPLPPRRDKQELEGGLKRDYQEQEAEKYRLIEQIHELGDRISRQKEEGRYYDEEIARNANKRLEY
jgi:hypothetical protein